MQSDPETVVIETSCCQWWGLILPSRLCSCFSSLYHGTVFLLAHPSLVSLCQHPTDWCQVIEGGDKDLEAVLCFENASEAR